MIYDKRMIYLSYVKDEVKVKSAGYIKIEIRNGMFYMDMHVNTKDGNDTGRYEVIADSKAGPVSLGMINLEEGKGKLQEEFTAEEIGRGGKHLSYEDIEAFRLVLEEGAYIIGRTAAGEKNEINASHSAAEQSDMQASDSRKNPAQVNSKNIRSVTQPHDVNNRRSVPTRDDDSWKHTSQTDDGALRSRAEETRAMPDKWQQLLKSYKQVHPYGDDRLYISIEPKDFMIMSAEYQHLAHNSFLLHGFYNYRHIVLGMENDCFYLGVPGVFYEREKMVAMMFGFEAFECQGGVAENGKNGYYLKKVKI